jgi:hypothetical protein
MRNHWRLGLGAAALLLVSGALAAAWRALRFDISLDLKDEDDPYVHTQRDVYLDALSA